MKDFEKSKEIYDKIEIPKELEDIVKNAIAASEEKRKQAEVVSLSGIKNKEKKKIKITTIVRYGMTTAAAMFLALCIGLNSSEALAMEMGSHPVWGALARVLTIRSYHGFDEEKGIQKDIEVPQIEVGEPGQVAEGSIGQANIDIQRIVDTHLVQAEADFEEYKKIFLENGGSEEEWAGRTMDLDVSYEIKHQDETTLSLVLHYSEVSAFAYEKAYYYNINLENNKELTLEDLLGSDYVSIANEQILAQMKQRMEEDENLYYWGVLAEEENDIEGFTTVDNETDFYINSQGNPVVTFEEYLVAPGYMGIQEFEIVKK